MTANSSIQRPDRREPGSCTRRRAGSARHIDLHLQFAPGTSLERAHAVAQVLQPQIRAALRKERAEPIGDLRIEPADVAAVELDQPGRSAFELRRVVRRTGLRERPPRTRCWIDRPVPGQSRCWWQPGLRGLSASDGP